MAAFEYQALDTQGRTVKGVIEGDAERQIRTLLRDKGLTPLDVNVIDDTQKQSGIRGAFSIRRSISTSDLALLTRQFATLIHAGLTIEECLNALIEQTESTRARSVFAGVRSRVMEGHSLANSMEDFPNAFPHIYHAMINAGEQSGKLDEVLDRLADYMENRQSLQNKITEAFIYPVIVSVLAFGMVSLLMVYVVPKVTQVFVNSGQELPALTQALITISDVVRAGGIWWFVGFIALFFGIRKALSNPSIKMRWHKTLLRLPVTGRLTRGVNAERMASTLGILTGSGLPLLGAMQSAVGVVNNLPMREALEQALGQVREGGNLSQALGKTKLFPPLIIHLIASGEATGKLDKMLVRAAEAQSREMENWVKTFTALLEPLLIVSMGIIVLLIVLAILMPIFEMNQLIR